MYLLSVTSISSRYSNKIKRTSYLGKYPALLLEILYIYFNKAQPLSKTAVADTSYKRNDYVILYYFRQKKITKSFGIYKHVFILRLQIGIFCMSSLVWGSHTGEAYSSWGLTIALYAFSLSEVFFCFKVPPYEAQ